MNDAKLYYEIAGEGQPVILGHAHPMVVQAVQDAAARGLSFGAPTEGEIDMARRHALERCEILRLGQVDVDRGDVGEARARLL